MTATVAPTRRGAADWLRAHLPETAVAIAAVGAALVLYAEGRGTNYFYDEWAMITDRRGNDADAFLVPHNGHLTLIPVVIYRSVFALFGLDHYGPLRLVLIAMHLATAVLFFVLVRRRIDDRVAALATVLLLFLGTAWQDLIWPFQMCYLGSMAAGLGAFLALDRDDRRGDVAAAFLLVLALASSGLGVPFMLGAAITVAWSPRWRARWWAIAVPAVLYGLWYVTYGVVQAKASNVRYVPGYIADSLAASLGAITGLGFDWGRPLAVVAALVVLARLWRGAAFSKRFVAVAAIALAFWGLTALTRGPDLEPAASRYLYPGAVLVMLAAVELSTRVQFTSRRVGLLAVLVLAAVAGNLGTLRDASVAMRMDATVTYAELAALELVRPVAPPEYEPDPTRAPDVLAGEYFAAVDDLGSPATPPDRLAGLGPEARTQVDRVFAEAGVAVEPGDVDVSGLRPDVEDGPLPRHADGSCVRATAHESGSYYVTTDRSVAVLPGEGTSVQVAIRRLADDFTEPFATVAGQNARIRIPADTLGVSWRIELNATGPFAVCGTP